MPIITKIYARQVLDSRGNPTVEVEVYSENGSFGSAIVPSGASCGKYEAHELRDGDDYYRGLGVKKAVYNVNEIIAPRILGLDCRSQLVIDETMIRLDNTKLKTNLGANAILAVSMACARCASDYLGISLYNYLGGFNSKCMPVPMMNILNGGAHANFSIDFQEIMIMPVGAKTFSEALRYGSDIFHKLGNILKNMGLSTTVGDEGGYAPILDSNTKALDLVMSAIVESGYKPGVDCFIALDVAASELYKDSRYFIDGKYIDKEELIKYYQQLVVNYPILSIEDPFEENDYASFSTLTSLIGDSVQIVGDDLFVTNTERLSEGIKVNACNAILVKVNQIGTLTEAFDAIEMAKTHGYGVIISHRSGETEDSIIADIAVSCNAMQIKCGSLSRTDRIAKYNRLLRIEDELNDYGSISIARFKGLKGLYNIRK